MTRTQLQRQQRGLDRIFYAGGDGIRMVPMLRGGAGSYPDAPSRRMAWDDDGTVVVGQDSAGQVLFEIAQSLMTQWNDESDVHNVGAESDLGHYWIFPELREVDGVVHSNDNRSPGQVDLQTAPDTTNGQDGTWTVRASSLPININTWRPDYRDDITSLAVSNIRGVWLDGSFGGNSTQRQRLTHCHLYGEISAGETPDRLLWFDDLDDLEFSLPIDYGDTPRGSAVDNVVYLKNNSASLTASSVQVTAEDLFLDMAAWFTYDEGSGFSSTLALASSIANGANSPDITIRRIIPDAEVLGLHAARTYVSVGTWA